MYKQYSKEIINIIDAGEAHKLTLSQILERVRGLPIVTKTLRKGMIRLLNSISKNNGNNLIVQSAGKGQPNYYYWQYESHKIDALARVTPQWNSTAHAMALSFIEDHLFDFLPQQYIDELQDDFDIARSIIIDNQEFLEKSDQYRSKLIFSPSGYALETKVKLEEAHRKIVFDCLDGDKTMSVTYNSIHKELPEDLILSPQQMLYINHQILLKCYEHSQGITKFFEINRFKNIDYANEAFKKIDVDLLNKTYQFKARVHTWVKHFFDNVKLGPEHKTKKPVREEKDCWIIESEVIFPVHFNSKKGLPDPFFFANFLGTFADSLEVLEPAFLRDEMMRRAQNYGKLYLEQNNDNHQTISGSPYDMANVE